MLLCDKYAPTTLRSIVGNNDSVVRLAAFGIEAQKKVPAKPMILYGPSGVGKTTAAKALAYSNGFELLELNSADYLDSENLGKLLLRASRSQSLFGSKLLVLLDEIDEIPKKEGSAAERIILELVKKSMHPVILIASDYWSRRIAFLRGYTDKCEFKRPGNEEVMELLRHIASKEGGKVDEYVLLNIASRCNGDVRGAINDLQTVIDADPEIMESLGARSRKLEIFGVLDKIFLSRDFNTARNGAANADVDLNMLISWVEENIQNRYIDKRSISDAFESLAAASMFLENANRKSYYDYLKYASVHASSGVALAGSGSYSMLRQYTFPTGISRLSKSKKDREISGGIAKKLIYSLHAHKKDINGTYAMLFKNIITKAIEEQGADPVYIFMETRFGLDRTEVDSMAVNPKV